MLLLQWRLFLFCGVQIFVRGFYEYCFFGVLIYFGLIMFMELYKFSRLVMHLNSCSMDLGRDRADLRERERRPSPSYHQYHNHRSLLCSPCKLPPPLLLHLTLPQHLHHLHQNSITDSVNIGILDLNILISISTNLFSSKLNHRFSQTDS